MSQQKKLEQILDFLVNEDVEKAEELLHDLVVEKARNIYEELVNEEDEDEEDMDEAMDESIGGDMKQDFTRDVRTAKEDIEADELQDGEVEVEFDGEIEDGEEGEEMDFDADGEFDDHEEEHMDVEDKVEDLESQLEELRAEFEQLMAAELDEPHHDEGDFEVDGEDEFEVDGEAEMEFEPEVEEGRYVGEATKLQDNVPDAGMGKEGKLTGTGKNSKSGATQTQSPYTKAPAKSIDGAKPVDFGKGSTGGEYTGPKGGDADSAKDDTPSSNIDVDQKDVNHGAQTTDGDFVGTGKNSKKGATNTKSPLSTAPKKP